MRLPRRVSLPFGYSVQVLEVTDAEMLDAQDEDDRDELCDGLWDDDTRTIRIRKAMSIKRKAYLLSHEMIHALADWQHHLFNEEAMKP